jgi:UDP-glucuronate decarboxylase
MAPLNNNKILVTGGTGFFGRALLEEWSRRFDINSLLFSVTVLTRSPKDFLDKFPQFSKYPWLEFHSGDVLDYKSLPSGREFTHILHAAADSTPSMEFDHTLRYDQIVNGTRNLLDFGIESGVKRFLYISSGAVYGPQPSFIDFIPEDFMSMPDPLNYNNSYGVAKRSAEHLCALYQEKYGLEVVIARCFSFVGLGLPLNAHFAIGNFIRDAIWSDKISVSGDGMAVRSYLDQRDLATWLIELLDRGQAGCAYNVGSDYAVSISDLANLVRDIISPEKSVNICAKFSSKEEQRLRYVPDISKIRSELKLDAPIPIEDSIRFIANNLI